MPDPRLVHCKRDPYDVYIGRCAGHANWGNPWVIGRHGTRAEVITRYEQWLRTGETFGNTLAKPEQREWILANLYQLKGKRLGCFCAPRLACHGAVLLTLLKEEGIE